MPPEHWFYTIPLRLRSLFRRRDVDRELDAELRDHLEQKIAAYSAAGMNPAEARRAALLELGGIARVAEECRDTRRVSWIQDAAQDLRYGLRMLRKNPGFTAVAILTLALGIGANTAIFSFIDAVLLRSLPVKDSQQLVLLRYIAHAKPNIHGSSGYGDCDSNARDGACSFSVPFFKTIRAEANTFSGMAAFAGPIDVAFSGNGAASIAQGTYVSGDFFSTLSVKTIVGRPLTAVDDTPSALPAIVLSYSYWVRAFGSDRSAVGRSVRLDNTAATIVGVTDPHFTNFTPGKTQDFFMPISLANRVRDEWAGHLDYLVDASNWWVVLIGRLKPGVPIGQAQAAATTIFRNVMLHSAPPVFKEADAPTIKLLPAGAGLNGESSRIEPMLLLMMIVVGFVLVIACANVAGLTLARSAVRQKEMAVRLALGAGRSRLIRQLLTENVLLSAIGGALGILFAVWGIGAISGLLSRSPDHPFPFVVAPDWRILAFTIAMALATGIFFGLAPALRGSHIDLTPSLKESPSSLPSGAAHKGHFVRLGDALVVAQVALSVVVLIGAGLLVRTMRNLQNINPGFDTHNILLFAIHPSIAGYTDAQNQQLFSNLQQRFAALPGVISASYSEEALLAGSWSGIEVHLDGAPPKQNINNLKQLPVGLNFFSTMRIPILAGRAFTSADFAAVAATKAARAVSDQAYGHAQPIAVIINESFALKFLPHQSPVGLHMGGADPGPGYTIVGIAGDTKYDRLNRETEPILFLPVVGHSAQFELRTAASPTALVKGVRDLVSQAGDNLPLSDVRTQTEQIERLLLQQRLLARLSAFFGALALALACIGLYGLLSYAVARRARELGIRMALGAQQRDLLRLVVGQGILLVLIGATIGIAAAMGVTRFMSAMLYGIRADNPATFAGVAILLALVALAACYVPARRATRVDPMVALRHE